MALDVRRLGSGPEVILVHGGSEPQQTWGPQEPLAERWTLVIPHRRGYGASPPAERQDFEVDAADLVPLLGRGAHVVGFSWGGLVAVIAAGEHPKRVRSLTVIEAPVYTVARGDPEVDRLERLSEEFLDRGADAGPKVLSEFLGLAAIPYEPGQPMSAELEEMVERAKGSRPVGEANPNLEAIRAAGIPSLVFSGGHSPGLETLCDSLADAIGAERAVLPGHGHAVTRAEGFNERLQAFLESAE